MLQKMNLLKILITVFVKISFIFAHGLEAHVRLIRQSPGGPPGGTGGPPGGAGAGMMIPNYNYPASSLDPQHDPIVNSWIKSSGISSTYKTYTNVNKIQYSSQYVYVSSSSIPYYSQGFGPWPNNPNTPSNQNFTFQFPRVPVPNVGNKTAVSLGNIGIWVNGVGMFNADDAQTIMGWARNAYFFESASFDNCNGHPQQQGEYHHHVIPKCLFDINQTSQHSPILGYAFDGYPVYGPFGYSNSINLKSPIKRLASSYRIRNIASRSTLTNGTLLTGPSINSTYPLGAFLDDFEYVPNLGDLDSSSGRLTVTPEYPNGTYAYFLSTDNNGNPAYPYTLGLNYYGIVIQSNLASGKVVPTETVTLYYTANSNIIKTSVFFSFFVSLLIVLF